MNKYLNCLLFVALLLCFKNGHTQTNSDTSNSIPGEYQFQFKTDNKRYLEFISPYQNSTGEAFNRWDNSMKGYLNYNVDSLYKIYNAARNKEILKRVEFTRLNPDSYVSLYYFNQQLLNSIRIEPDSLLKIYSYLSPKLQATALGKSVLGSIKRKQSLLLHQIMPDFSFKTNKKEETSLSAFRGQKYVLLCFWASWCGPCIRNIPFLKQVNETYARKGLQIISVSLDKDILSWSAAVEKYGLTWLQTCDLPEYTGKSKLSTLYEVHLIPQYFLIDKTGKLIYQNILSNEGNDHLVLKKVLEKELN